jgi:hypothetical protein
VDIPDGQEAFLKINTRLAAHWPVIIREKTALPGAEQWVQVEQELHLLEKNPWKICPDLCMNYSEGALSHITGIWV